MSRKRTPEEQSAYDEGWNLAELGHTDMLGTYMGRPDLRKVFEEGWADGEASFGESNEEEALLRDGLSDEAKARIEANQTIRTRNGELLAENERLRAALEKISRTRLTTSEGSLAKRADRMWQMAEAALGRPMAGGGNE